MINIEDTSRPASLLVDLYLRLRSELDGGEYSLDPNHRIRAAIAVAIFNAAESIGSDIVAIEARVRRELKPATQLLAA